MAEETTGTARVMGRDLSVSKKQAVEVCSLIRGRSVRESKTLLGRVALGEVAVPFRKFHRDMGHKPGHQGPGRYPVKTSLAVVKLLESLEANAQNKGLDVNRLYIVKVVANKAPTPWHFGRFRRRKMKRAHIEIVAAERRTEAKGTSNTKKGEAKKK